MIKGIMIRTRLEVHVLIEQCFVNNWYYYYLYHPPSGLMQFCILIGYTTRGLIVIDIESQNLPVFLSFFPQITCIC